MTKTLLLLTLLLATPALGQDVDVQVRLGIKPGPGRHEVACTKDTEVGRPDGAPYENCNETIPYVPPARWFCAQRAYCHIYGAAPVGNVMDGRVLVTWLHDRTGHSYHEIKCPVATGIIPLDPPIAFPPGDPVALRVRNNSGVTVWVLSHLAGYLGRGGTEKNRACACRPAGTACP